MSFDSLVAKLMNEGKSEESAKKIAGSVANAKMHGAGSGPTAAQKARSAGKQMKSPAKRTMKTNQDGGDDSTTEAADQLKKLGSPTKQESSWQHEDNIRAEKFRKEGHYGHADALDKDADSAGHGRDWTGVAEQKSFAKQFSEKSPMNQFKDFDQMDTWDADATADAGNVTEKAPTPQHGESKGDQSKSRSDYANYKGTDAGYHGHTGSSHGDQSATRRDYMPHVIHKHMKK